MCDIKFFLMPVCLILLVTASICTYRVFPDKKKLRQYSEVNKQIPSEIEYKDYCLNSGECYYLINEVFDGCICTWFTEEKTF